MDGHNDFLFFIVDDLVSEYTGKQTIDFGSDLSGTTHLDLNRQKEGGLDVQIFSVFCLGSQEDPFDMAMRQIDSLESISARYSDEMVIATNSDEIERAIAENKSIAMIGVEGGHMIEEDLANLETLYNRGTRYLTLTWNNSTSWATSSYDEQPEKEFGRKGVDGFWKGCREEDE